jgi:ATP-dependent 26S proteasome regulatory subunit
MSKMNTSKSLLTSIQKLSSSIQGQVLSDQLINELVMDSQPIMEFYDLTHFQALVFSVYLEAKLKDRDIDLEKMVEIFGKKLSMLAEVNIAIEELISKKLVYYKRQQYRNRIKDDHNNIICVIDKAAAALMKGDKSLMETTKVDNFFSLLSQIRELIVKRIDLIISTEDLCDEMIGLLNLNKDFHEVQWLLSYPDLSKYDLAILINICIEHMEGQEEVNIDKMIKETFSEIQDRIRYSRNIKDNKCPLYLNDLVTNSEDEFSFLNFVRLSSHSMEVLLGGYEETITKVVKPKLCIVYKADKIKKETLFYNDVEKKQIETIAKALEEENYKKLSAKLQEKGLRTGINILLYGAAGAGKTSTVMQWAAQTGRDVFFLDISGVQSKFVGEAEKQLQSVWTSYRECRKTMDKAPILLFNEADAILGTRMTAESSASKSYNTLQNIMLQNMEDFEDGIFIATTNLASHLDPAFERRFLYKVEYKKPEAHVRKQILNNIFTDISLDTIDKINETCMLTGGQIQNVHKKILINSLLDEEANSEETIFSLCLEEFVLSKSERKPIGFIQ